MWKLELGGVRWWVVLLLGMVAWLAFGAAMQRIRVESDVFAALPRSSPELESSRRLLRENALTEQIGVDIHLSVPGPLDELLPAADEVARAMRESGLFASVGLEPAAAGMLELNALVASHLPLHFGAEELAREVAPALTPAAIRAALRARLQELTALEGTGTADLIRQDPLDLRAQVLARLRGRTVGLQGRLERGHLVSTDDHHVLLTAVPLRSVADGESNRSLAAFFTALAAQLETPTPDRPGVHLDVVGGFRAALDNEAIVRADTQRALTIAGLGVALLLLLFFSRPVLGVLSLLPAATGVSLGLLALSYLDREVSALSLGFGGALVSIAVDQGILFTSFLDRFRDRSGRRVAAAIFAPGLLATTTTAGAFLSLRWSGFEILAELGTFAALSTVASFAIVQLVFPFAFRPLPPRPARPLLPLARGLRLVCVNRGLRLAAVVVLAVVALLLAARPGFSVDLAAMSTVSPAAAAAERNVQARWGNALSNVYVFVDAESERELRVKSDRLEATLAAAAGAGHLGRWFSPARVLPGPERAARNARAWKTFFTPGRRAVVAADLIAAGRELGFADDAFSPFLTHLDGPHTLQMPMPTSLMPLLGVSHRENGRWGLLLALERGERYEATSLATAVRGLGGAFHDGQHLSRVLGEFLRSAFLRMVLLIGGFVVLFVALTFVEPLLIGVVLAPVLLGLAATLGLLGALGRTLDMAGVLLAIVVLGMGVDFSIHLVRSHQLHPDETDREHDPVRAATFLECAATAIGMGGLSWAQHGQAKSAGIVGLLGITSCGLGAFLLLPPLLRRLFAPLGTHWSAEPARPERAAFRRYRYLPVSQRSFAWWKLRLDPMFPRLRSVAAQSKRLLDVGCGYGVPAAYLLAWRDELSVVALEPDPSRAQIARVALGPRGVVHELAAPALPTTRGFDLALMLDVAHHLDDEALTATLAGIRWRLDPVATLLMRVTVPFGPRPSWLRRLETWRLERRGLTPRFRSLEALTALLRSAGLEATVESIPAREEVYLFARPAAPGDRP